MRIVESIKKLNDNLEKARGDIKNIKKLKKEIKENKQKVKNIANEIIK